MNSSAAMDEDCDNNDDFSLSLSRALDEIGLNEVTVQARQEKCMFAETLNNSNSTVVGNKRTAYMFGSQSEGTTTPGLGSDYDMLLCFNEYTVIQDVSEWTAGKINLLMLQETTAPGYCMLQLMQMDQPEPMVTLPHVYDCGRVLVKNVFDSSAYLAELHVQVNAQQKR